MIRKILDRTTTQSLIALILTIAFFWFCVFDNDPMMRGALISAFTGAVGFYLGDSQGAKTSRDQVGEANALTRAAVRALSTDANDAPTRSHEANSQSG